MNAEMLLGNINSEILRLSLKMKEIMTSVTTCMKLETLC
jgi:hypothetical protein